MPSELIPLEDDPCDIIAKAMRGQSMQSNELAVAAGVSNQIIEDLLSGKNDTRHIAQVANALGLNANALSNLASYRPEIRSPDGLYQVVSSFGHAGVNAYFIQHGNSTTVFDTGTDADELLDLIHSKGLKVAQLLITHRHHDHTACVNKFEGIPIIYPENIAHGDLIKTDHQSIKALDVSGHMSPAKAFYYEGLDTPICIVGDAVFAGSMGGTSGPDAYTLSLDTALNNLMTLTPETVLCPGHGPLTNVELEQQHNPFLCKKSI